MCLDLKKISSHLRNEKGNVTVEFVVLFPVLLLLMGVTMDVAFMYYKKSQIHEAIQSVTRWRSIGAISTNTQAESDLAALLTYGFTDEATVTMQLKGALVSTSVDVPLHDLQLIGFFAGLVGDPMINIGDQQFLESYSIAEYDTNSGWTPEEMIMVEGIMQSTSPLDETTTTTTVPDIIF